MLVDDDFLKMLDFSDREKIQRQERKINMSHLWDRKSVARMLIVKR